MLTKLGVNISNLDCGFKMFLEIIEEVFQKYALREAIITSGNDSVHSSGSYHYKDCALDFRTNDLEKTVAVNVTNEVRNRLPSYFDVVLEGDHLHIEKDLKKFSKHKLTV